MLGISVDSYASYIIALRVIAMLVWSSIGLLIFTRKSSDPVALLAALMLSASGNGFTGYPEALARVYPTWALPIQILGAISFTSVILFLYLFPSGHFVPTWTRWLALAWIINDIVGVFFPLSAWLDSVGFVLFFVPAICAVGSQIYRYRRVSNPTQRRQIKWVVFGIVAGFGGYLALVVAAGVTWGFDSPRSGLFLEAFSPVLLLAIPLSIGVAILRSRLWDIDVIINRTLVYGTLTVSLALVYVGCVILLRQVLAPLTGSSELAIVASTLAIAALFTPLRRRIQEVIDHRFYRRKYDAAKILAAFSATVRDETDLDKLTDRLVDVVQETMQPAHVSLWLSKIPERGRPSEREVKR